MLTTSKASILFILGEGNMKCSEYLLSKLTKKQTKELEEILTNHQRLDKSRLHDGVYVFTQDWHMGFIIINVKALEGVTDEVDETIGHMSRTLSIAAADLLIRMEVKE